MIENEYLHGNLQHNIPRIEIRRVQLMGMGESNGLIYMYFIEDVDNSVIKTGHGQTPTGQNPTGQNPTAIFGREDKTPLLHKIVFYLRCSVKITMI